MQELVDLPTSASLKVTVARWLTPESHSISLNGLTPDIVVEKDIDLILAGGDNQLDVAIDYFN
ncbi:hypothetical protein CL653_00280 [bacterium]|nr:hypothetical protein [bacterium]